MDRAWIKFILIAAFVVTLIITFVTSFQALKAPNLGEFKAPDPPPVPTWTIEVKGLTPEQIEIRKKELEAYGTAVTAYTKQVEAEKLEWTAANDPNRLDRFEKVVKNTLGALILTPLLAALIIYSGIQVSGDLSAARIVTGGGVPPVAAANANGNAPPPPPAVAPRLARP